MRGKPSQEMKTGKAAQMENLQRELKKPNRKRKVRVHRSNVDPENRMTPISVNVIGAGQKKVFTPGTEVELFESQIQALRDAVEEHEIRVPPGSGVYESNDSKQTAERLYPGFFARVDPATATLIMTKREPNYIIEPMDL